MISMLFFLNILSLPAGHLIRVFSLKFPARLLIYLSVYVLQIKFDCSPAGRPWPRRWHRLQSVAVAAPAPVATGPVPGPAPAQDPVAMAQLVGAAAAGADRCKS